MGNIKPLVTIGDWLNKAQADLTKANIPSAQLDAEVLLCYILGVERTWLIAHKDDSLHATALRFSGQGSSRRGSLLDHADELIQKRLKRLPIAYITGHKEFYGRNFIINKHALVPRPETEALVDLAKKHGLSGNLLDVGTGSGCLGVTLALELELKLTVSDISEDALSIAKKNVKALGVKPVRYVISDLLEHWISDSNAKPFDVIAANLPYVDKRWERSPETEHEPSIALFARDNGLEVINELIEQAPQLLSGKGYLLLEADPEQHKAIITLAKQNHLSQVETDGYAILLRKN